MQDEILQSQARQQDRHLQNFAFDDKFIDMLIGRMDQNKEIFEKRS